ncbi:hypothetical protein D8M04_16990 [Oceanobacillus piezotolerans]|uniref:Regulatory protein YycH-like domain-containing protein n=1 Tax=Oceanobacillus piezotolerans TaxID=2448030 RepID=A0A498D7A3_9BACI|nr:two-component system regulatory protein YycI [Oceanobacillus piezotolerans]RLL41764.1 hypothetical protein D8M04_16990 [Oceanobacillus piezotolerans]
MQWGHIKTLFILSFLILNIYLLIQFMNKQEEADIGVLQNPETTLEERLQAENISIPNLDEFNVEEGTYILSSNKVFTEEEVKQINQLENQVTTVLSGNHLVVSRFEEPVSVSEKTDSEGLNQFVQASVLYGDQYTFWEWNKELNVIVFFQKYGERPVYYNENGILLLYLNNRNEITHYSQTMLTEAEPQGNSPKSIIQPLQAIDLLADEDHVLSNDNISEVEMGYYSRLAGMEEEQIFAPTWRVTVDNERNYFVNAIEGLTYSDHDLTFIKEVMEGVKTSMQTISDEEEIKEPFMDILDQKLETNKTE